MKSFKNYIRPLCRPALQNFPFIEQDFDSLNNYELLCKVVEYLNKVINSQNEVTEKTEELSSAFTNLKNYVDNYFAGLDVQDEVNNKLDQMVEDGTLARIINEELFQDILGRVENLEETTEPLPEIAEEPLFLSCFFTTTGDKAKFYASRDLKNYALLSETGDLSLRDASLAEYNGYIYIASTYQTASADLIIRRTKDFVTFEEFPINLGLDKSKSRWAPSIMLDNDKFIVTVSLRTASGIQTGSSDIYRSEAPADTLEFITPSKLTSITQTKAIDSDLFKHGDLYYLLVKDDIYETPKTYLYKSTDSRTFEFVREMTEFPSADHDKVEGMFGLSLGNKLFVGADNYDNMTYGNAVQLGLFTSNIEQPSKNGIFVCNNGSVEHMRHGSTIMVNELNLKGAVLSKQETVAGDHHYEMFIGLSSYAVDNVIEDLYIYPNVTYYIAGNVNITINKLHNPFQCDTANFQFRQATGTSLTIVNNGYSVQNYKFINDNKTNGRIISLKNTPEGFMPIVGYENAYVTQSQEYNSSTTIDATDNSIYRLGSGTYTITLQGKADKVFFRKVSGATGTVTITDGYFSYTLNLGNMVNNSLQMFIHIVNNWFMVN